MIAIDSVLSSPEIDPANHFLIYHGKVLVCMARVVRAALPYAQACAEIEKTVSECHELKIEIARIDSEFHHLVPELDKRVAVRDALKVQTEPLKWDLEKLERKARQVELLEELK